MVQVGECRGWGSERKLVLGGLNIYLSYGGVNWKKHFWEADERFWFLMISEIALGRA